MTDIIHYNTTILSRKEYLYTIRSISDRRKTYLPETPMEYDSSSNRDITRRSRDHILHTAKWRYFSLFELGNILTIDHSYSLSSIIAIGKRIDPERSDAVELFDAIDGFARIVGSRHSVEIREISASIEKMREKAKL
jgi:hypothetical protein